MLARWAYAVVSYVGLMQLGFASVVRLEGVKLVTYLLVGSFEAVLQPEAGPCEDVCFCRWIWSLLSYMQLGFREELCGWMVASGSFAAGSFEVGLCSRVREDQAAGWCQTVYAAGSNGAALMQLGAQEVVLSQLGLLKLEGVKLGLCRLGLCGGLMRLGFASYIRREDVKLVLSLFSWVF